MSKKRMWLEPEEGWHQGFRPGDIVRDIRSGQFVRVIKLHEDRISHPDPECCCGHCNGSIYYSYRVQLLDGTDLPDGWFRAPEDLEKRSPLVLLAECAEEETDVQ